MIASLLLTLSMLGQYNANKPFWHVPGEVRDLCFTYAQESWVYEQKKGFIYRWDDVLPQFEADLLDTLSSEKYSVRRMGLRILKDMDFDAVRACTWGINGKSENLREICSNHLYYLMRCSYCKGTGNVTIPASRDYREYNVVCNGCKGSKTFYQHDKYNNNTGEYELVRRNLFAKTIPFNYNDY